MTARRSQRWLAKACQIVGCKLTLFSLVNLNHGVLAQVVPDTTLPLGEQSQVSPGPLFQIDGGAVRDRNLFHSFGQFSLLKGETAFFNNTANITNIISRVTGGQRSQIDGVIRANGSANLFLINPNGILLGPNAALNIGGTFLVTTASAVQFGNQGVYSAINSDAPGLLTVDPSALLFSQIATQPIRSQAKLQVPIGKSLAMVGGNIVLDKGILLAEGGRVELGGLAGKGSVELEGGSSNLRLNFGALPPALANVSLVNGSEVNVRSGGSIVIQAQNVSLANRSALRGGIAANQSTLNGKAGDIDINASGAFTLTDSSFIANSTAAGGIGDSGNVNVNAGSVLLKDGSQVNASTFGKGNSGTVTIRSPGAVIFDGEDSTGRSGGTYSRVNSGAVGSSGGINIIADSLLVTNGAVLSANTLANGNAGSVNIRVRGDVRFDGVGSIDQFPSGVYTGVGDQPFGNKPAQPGFGNSGGLNVIAGSLSIANGARLDATTSPLSQGNAGKIQIQTAGAVNLNGDPSGKLADPGGIYTYTGDTATGNSGGIALTASSLVLRSGAALVASTFGKGNAGDVDVRVAGPVVLDGQSSPISTGIFGSVTRIAKGNSGQIRLAVDSLTVLNGAAIAASILGKGKAAGVNITATGDVTFDGVASDGFPSGIFSRIGASATGNSDITVTARSLSLSNGAQFQANTLGAATAGSIQINTTDDIRITGKNAIAGLASGLFSTTIANGNGGDVNLNARSLSLQDGAVISAQSRGAGRAGSIAIQLRNRLQARDSKILTTSAQSSGGNIAITAHTIALRGDSDITTSVFSGVGGGGNITLSAAAIVALDDSDILAFSRDGSGGNITLNAPAFFGFRYRSIPSNDPTTLDGNEQVDVNASGRLRSGTVTLPDVTPLQNNLTQLPSEVIDTSRLIANSCIARNNRQGSFIVTGAGGLPNSPDDLATAPFPTYAMTPETSKNLRAQRQENATPSNKNNTVVSNAIVEIDGIYQLESGDVVLGRSCAGL